jgi:sugar phosphate isomerase/epimerase
MLFTWNGVGDRFQKNYFDPMSVNEIIPSLSDIEIDGVELQCPNHVNKENLETVRELLLVHKLQAVIINVPLAGSIEYRQGSLTSPSAEVRRQAVEHLKTAMDVSRELGAYKISCFLGQDGFDYPLTTDYRKMRTYLLEGFEEAARYAPDVNIAIEYKPREPRSRQFLSSASRTLLLANEIGLPNIGLLVDIGHAWMAGENMGEVIELVSSQDRLFHVHMNDNFLLADDDLGVAGVHLPEYLEAMYWLKTVGYSGFVSIDVHSPREAPNEIIGESVAMLRKFDKLTSGKRFDEIRNLIEARDGALLLKYIREQVLIP